MGRVLRFPRPGVWLGLCLGLWAAEGAAFDLLEAFAAAKTHSADYAAARYAGEAEAEQKRQALAPLLPQASATAHYRHQPASSAADSSSRGWQVQVSQVLFDPALTAQYRQGRLAAEAAAWRVKEAESRLLLEVAQAYLAVLQQQDSLAAIREEKAAYTRQRQQARALFDKGAATIVDVHEAQAGHDAALAKEIDTVSRLQLARHRLADLTGLTETLPQALSPAGPPADWLAGRSESDWQTLARQHNPERQLQQLALEQARQAVAAARGGHSPKLSLNGAYQDHRNTQDYGGFDRHYRSKGGSVSVQLNIPLYSGGQTASRVREAAARELQQRELLTAAERRVRLAVHQAYRQTHDARYRILAQQRLWESNRSKLESVRLGRQVGVRSNLDELQAVQAEAEARQQLAEARYGQIMAYLQLLAHSGTLTDETGWAALRQRLYGPARPSDPSDQSSSRAR